MRSRRSDPAKTKLDPTINEPDPSSTEEAVEAVDRGEDVDPLQVVADLAGRQGFVDKRLDLAVSFGVVGIGLFLLIGSLQIRTGLVTAEVVGAAGLPRLLGGFMVVAGGILIARRLKTWKQAPHLVPSEGGDADEPGYPTTFVRPLLYLLAGFLWTVLMPTLGYLLATPLAGVVLLLLAKVREWPKLVFVPLGFVIVTWLLFDRLIGIPLPPGDFIGRWFDQVVPRF